MTLVLFVHFRDSTGFALSYGGENYFNENTSKSDVVRVLIYCYVWFFL